ncbi:GAF domain-containing sensor histidine kinase [Undibacterium fentianense]|uniref:histidine kinase n=1 Tax=Undibacterium fentianense TaxID=2828728 RepID=A0A941E5G5_9BURK|nr:GAF domain-containing protein [Undibacterium fentianense]MBR7799118.1 GAF domain-containing protein [Undibacterium fentianense]
MNNRLQRLEAVQDMVLEIGKISSNTNDIREFLQAIHMALSKIMYAKNFYIALYDADDESIQFAYFLDEVDPPPNPTQKFKLEAPGSSFTKWVIQNQKPLVADAIEMSRITEDEKNTVSGAPSEHWMGYPLIDHQKRTLGAMVIQSYDKQAMYSNEDQALFEMIAHHVSNALEAFQSVDRLERAVQERTALLAHEIAERRRSEKIQSALYAIAELSFSGEEGDLLYRKLHWIVENLIVAKNFLVALYHPESEEISIQYFIDEKDPIPSHERFPLGVGMTSYVVRTGRAQLIDKDRLKQLIQDGEIKQVLGDQDIESWLGVPILIKDKIYGVIIVQSYDLHHTYGAGDLELLAFVANHIAVAISRMNADRELRQTKVNLEHQNNAINDALLALKEAQSELVRQEKLASLGSLVAGVAHEINTPLGICVTATSHLVEEVRLTRKDMADGKFEVSQLEPFLDIVDQSLRILSTNTKRAASLVRSFKQVAVDQTSNDRRQFQLLPYLNETLVSLQPKLKGRNITIDILCPTDLVLDSYPGAISQILTNFIMNSLHHGFENRPNGHITIKFELSDGELIFDYLDDGNGMNQESLGKLFDPFYTTKRGQGGSGLGTHIVYNLVTSLLGGTIKAQSSLGNGLAYSIRFPLLSKQVNAPQKANQDTLS